MLNEKTLDYVRKQLDELRKPVFMGRVHNENEIENESNPKRFIEKRKAAKEND